jgi:hypothetical protein
MKKDCTEIVFILDRSGSMSGLEEDTIGGYNALLKKQQAVPGTAIISTVLFNHHSHVLHNRISIDKVEPLSEVDYSVAGSTALLDAVGSSINFIRRTHSHIVSVELPEKTLFVITTDGMENASEHYNYKQVEMLIESQKEKAGWEFMFLGANMDSMDVARRFGIHADHAANYHSDKAGTQLNYDVLSDAIIEVRTKKTIQANWKTRIDDDYKSRK